MNAIQSVEKALGESEKRRQDLEVRAKALGEKLRDLQAAAVRGEVSDEAPKVSVELDAVRVALKEEQEREAGLRQTLSNARSAASEDERLKSLAAITGDMSTLCGAVEGKLRTAAAALQDLDQTVGELLGDWRTKREQFIEITAAHYSDVFRRFTIGNRAQHDAAVVADFVEALESAGGSVNSLLHPAVSTLAGVPSTAYRDASAGGAPERFDLGEDRDLLERRAKASNQRFQAIGRAA